MEEELKEELVLKITEEEQKQEEAAEVNWVDLVNDSFHTYTMYTYATQPCHIGRVH